MELTYQGISIACTPAEAAEFFGLVGKKKTKTSFTPVFEDDPKLDSELRERGVLPNLENCVTDNEGENALRAAIILAGNKIRRSYGTDINQKTKQRRAFVLKAFGVSLNQAQEAVMENKKLFKKRGLSATGKKKLGGLRNSKAIKALEANLA